MTNSGSDGRASYRRRKRAQMHAEAESEAVAFSEIARHEDVVQGKPEMVVEPEALASLVDHIRDAGSFAYDTEFIGEETFYPRICLVQVATADRLALVDPTAFEHLDPIFELVASSEVETLVHDGAQDLEPVRRRFDREPEGIVDTQVCAAFLDMPWPSSLAKVVERFVGHRLTKGHTFTDWDARPLTDRQIRYAADDVRFLPLVWSRIRTALEAEGRLDWAMRECHESRRRHVGRFDAEKQVRKILKGSRLKAKATTVLRSLVLLRHRLAESLDLPHRVVLSDESLVDLVRGLPENASDLERCRHLGRRTRQDHGEEILACIAEARKEKPQPLERRLIREESAQDRMRIDALWSVLTLRCLADGISPSLMSSRAELSRWYLAREAGEESEPLFATDSWRHDVVGAWLDAFLAGSAGLDLGWSDGRLVRRDRG